MLKNIMISIFMIALLTSCGGSDSGAPNESQNEFSEEVTVPTPGNPVILDDDSSNGESSSDDSEEEVVVEKRVTPLFIDESCTTSKNDHNNPTNCTCSYADEVYNGVTGLCERETGNIEDVKFTCSDELNQFGHPNYCPCKIANTYNPKSGTCVDLASDKISDDVKEDVAKLVQIARPDEDLSDIEWNYIKNDILENSKSLAQVQEELALVNTFDNKYPEQNLLWPHGHNICLGKWTYSRWNNCRDESHDYTEENSISTISSNCDVDKWNQGTTSACSHTGYEQQTNSNCPVKAYPTCTNGDICGWSGPYPTCRTVECGRDTSGVAESFVQYNVANCINRADTLCPESEFPFVLVCMEQGYSPITGAYVPETILSCQRANLCESSSCGHRVTANTCSNSGCPGTPTYQTCNDTSKPTYGPCRHEDHGAESYKECKHYNHGVATVGGIQMYTLARDSVCGMSEEAEQKNDGENLFNILAIDGIINQTRFNSNDPKITCETCDDYPTTLNDITDVLVRKDMSESILTTNKYNCLKSQFNANGGSSSDTKFHNSIKMLKLQFNKRNEFLTKEQIDFVEQISKDFPSISLLPTESSTEIANSSCNEADRTKLQMISEYSGLCSFKEDQVISENASLMCLNLIIDSASALSSDCQHVYASAVDHAVEKILKRHVFSIKEVIVATDEDGKTKTRLNQLYLKNLFLGLKKWANMGVNSILHSRDRHSKMIVGIQRTIDSLWKHIFKLRSSGILSLELTEEVLIKDQAEVIKALNGVLEASSGDLSNLILIKPLTLVSEQIFDRVLSLTKIYDLTCQFKNCNIGSKHELVLLFQLFSNLDNPEGLESLNSSIHDEETFNDLFVQMKRSSRHLKDLLAKTIDNERFPHFSYQLFDMSNPLLGIIENARSYHTNIKNKGTFKGRIYNEIDFGFTHSNTDKIGKLKNTLVNNLDTKLKANQIDTTVLLGEFIGEENLEQQRKVLDNKFELLEYELDLLHRDKVNQVYLLDSDALSFTDYMFDFTEIILSDYYNNVFKNVGRISGLSTTAVNAFDHSYYNEAPNTSIERTLEFLLQRQSQWTIDVKKGDTLNVSITGQWSPICAITKEELLSDSINVPLTGPEGYAFQITNSDQQLVSKSNVRNDTEYVNGGESRRNCHYSFSEGGFSADASNAKILGTGVAVGPYVRFGSGSRSDICNETSSGTNSSNSINQSDVTSRTASFGYGFNGGLKSIYAPFPDHPVGSLLLMGVHKRNGSVRIVDIKYLQKNSTLLVKEDASYYLVVNDCKAGNEPTNSLNVNFTHLRPEEENTKRLYDAVLEAIDTIGQRYFSTYKYSKSISLTELANLRKEFYALLSKHGYVRGQNNVFDALYDYWIDKEILTLERKVKIKGIEDRIAYKKMELQQIAKELETSKSITEAYSKKTKWIADNFDVNELGIDFEKLLDFTYNTYFPLIKFKYPDIYEYLKSEQSFVNLTGIGLSSKVVESANDLVDLINSVSTYVEDLNIRKSPETSYIVGLRFPKPKEENTDTISANFFDEMNDSRFNRANLAYSKSVWDSIYNVGGPAKFSIDFSDLYNPLSFKSLNCDQSAPIINGMALYFVYNDDAEAEIINGQTIGVPKKISVSQKMTYALEHGPEDYIMTNGAWLTPKAPILFGYEDEAAKKLIDRFNITPNFPGLGLSPFANFEIDFYNEIFRSTEMSMRRDNISDFILLLRLDTRTTSGDKLDWIESCQ
ncbi:hypothetical protein OAB57_00525 [Bacteriovoracaceae bacterium]|nr:hypothetical protein [Bacteriovoracaceae bacterium]